MFVRLLFYQKITRATNIAKSKYFFDKVDVRMSQFSESLDVRNAVFSKLVHS